MTIMFRGREQSHPERGRMLLDRLQDVSEIATMEQEPPGGLHMTMCSPRPAPAAEKAAARAREPPAPRAGETGGGAAAR